jgi:predicted RNase H-like HicB family nuclease
MSQAREADDSGDVTITLDGEWYVARDEETGVASQGKTRPEALANLAEALELHERPVPDDGDVDEPSSAPWL